MKYGEQFFPYIYILQELTVNLLTVFSVAFLQNVTVKITLIFLECSVSVALLSFFLCIVIL